jgi:hypothetical protein
MGTRHHQDMTRVYWVNIHEGNTKVIAVYEVGGREIS